MVSVFVMLVICDQLDYRKFKGKSTVRHITHFDESDCVLTSHHHFIYLNFQISRLWVAWKMFAGETCVGFVLSLPISVEIRWVATCCKHVLVTTLQTFFKLLCFTNVLKPITDKPPIWEWFTPTIYGDFGHGLLLFYPHYTDCNLLPSVA